MDDIHLEPKGSLSKNFAGLGLEKQQLLIDGKPYKLQKTQKIVFISSLSFEETIHHAPVLTSFYHSIPSIHFKDLHPDEVENNIRYMLGQAKIYKLYSNLQLRNDLARQFSEIYYAMRQFNRTEPRKTLTPRNIEDVVLHFIYYYERALLQGQEIDIAQYIIYAMRDAVKLNYQDALLFSTWLRKRYAQEYPSFGNNRTPVKTKQKDMFWNNRWFSESKIKTPSLYASLQPEIPELPGYIMVDEEQKVNLLLLIKYLEIMDLKIERELKSFGTDYLGFQGESGVGKTTMVTKCFEQLGVKFFFATANNAGDLYEELKNDKTSDIRYVLIDEFNANNISYLLKKIQKLPRIRVILLANPIDHDGRKLLAEDVLALARWNTFSPHSREAHIKYAVKQRELLPELADIIIGNYFYSKKNINKSLTFREFEQQVDDVLEVYQYAIGMGCSNRRALKIMNTSLKWCEFDVGKVTIADLKRFVDSQMNPLHK